VDVTRDSRADRPGQIQIVRRLVEQKYVGAADQRRRQPQPSGLPAGEPFGVAVPYVDPQSQPVAHLCCALGEVGATGGQPVLQRRVVRIAHSS